jgi:hypothetical protein
MDKIDTKIKYEKPVFIEVEVGKNAHDISDAHPFKRTDYHEDGSQTVWYGFEVAQKEYEAFLILRDHPEVF